MGAIWPPWLFMFVKYIGLKRGKPYIENTLNHAIKHLRHYNLRFLCQFPQPLQTFAFVILDNTALRPKPQFHTHITHKEKCIQNNIKKGNYTFHSGSETVPGTS